MFELIPPNPKIDFLALFRPAVAVSLVVLLIGIASLVIRGPNYGIDFSGGTLVHVRFQKTADVGAVRDAVAGLTGDATVQDFGRASSEFLIRLSESDPDLKKGLADRIREALQAKFGADNSFEILRVESVGPGVGSDLRLRALLSVLAATVMMTGYIALRFEVRFGIGAGLALLHDVLIAVGALSLFGYELDLTIVAALLTIVGFSVNDTVIVSDRIRENMHRSRREPLASIINRSINETLSRTILTNGTAILVVIVLYVLGGEVIHGFAFTLLVGFVVGTYSSIFIASPLVLRLGGSTATESKPSTKAPAKTRAARP